MTVIGFFLGLIIILQIFILVGICRTNYKLEELDATVSKLSNLIVPIIGANMESIAHVLDQLTDIATGTKKKHKKKKGENFYADNESES